MSSWLAAVKFTSDSPTLRYSYRTGAMVRIIIYAAVVHLFIGPVAYGCGGNYTGSGIILSPNYPSVYSNNLTCTWNLYASPANASVSLQFQAFSTESCCDVLTVFRGQTQIGRYSGSSIPSTVTVPNQATVVFTTDYSVVSTGFSIVFTSNRTDTAVCGGNFTGFGTIQSPGFPLNYSNNVRCTWNLQALPSSLNSNIILRILAFSTESGFDFLNIFDRQTRIVLWYSGTTIPSTITLGSQATLEFTSDSSVVFSGFQILFTSAGTNTAVCGGNFTGSGTIQSPGFPLPYSNNLRCTWNLQALPSSMNSNIILSIRAFSIESGFDFLSIIDQQTKNVLRYSGSNVPSTITLGSQATLEFTSDSSVVFSGFQIFFTSAEPSTALCGGNFTGSGIIQSPGFPLTYSNNLRCTWNLQALSSSLNSSIVLRIQAFSTESGYDVLSIIDQQTRLIQRYSGTTIPWIITLGSQATLEFTSDSSVVFSGFKMLFTSVGPVAYGCGGNYTGSGIIRSPNYPNVYSSNLTCTWNLNASPANASVSLQFQAFSTESCCDILTVFRGQTQIGRYSGSSIPSTVTVPNQATVVFTTDYSVVSTGFSIVFTSNGAV